MNEYDKILYSLCEHLKNVTHNNGDLGDVGNEIGICIAKFINNDKVGYEKEDFIHGIRHGISLVDGTHDSPVNKDGN